MLVLARRINESIMIGDDIEVVVIDIKGDQVKLGVKAPKKVTVHRKEIYDEIRRSARHPPSRRLSHLRSSPRSRQPTPTNPTCC
ncbi:MAG: carbon storage regulator CsrA, partial [Spirochaetota bacterium]